MYWVWIWWLLCEGSLCGILSMLCWLCGKLLMMAYCGGGQWMWRIWRRRRCGSEEVVGAGLIAVVLCVVKGFDKFLYEDLPHLLDELQIDKTMYDDRIPFCNPVTKLRIVNGYQFSIQKFRLYRAWQLSLSTKMVGSEQQRETEVVVACSWGTVVPTDCGEGGGDWWLWGVACRCVLLVIGSLIIDEDHGKDEWGSCGDESASVLTIFYGNLSPMTKPVTTSFKILSLRNWNINTQHMCRYVISILRNGKHCSEEGM